MPFFFNPPPKSAQKRDNRGNREKREKTGKIAKFCIFFQKFENLNYNTYSDRFLERYMQIWLFYRIFNCLAFLLKKSLKLQKIGLSTLTLSA